MSYYEGPGGTFHVSGLSAPHLTQNFLTNYYFLYIFKYIFRIQRNKSKIANF
ncbi:hypothetical protein ACRRTK_020283 [Alexandromys fortis]